MTDPTMDRPADALTTSLQEDATDPPTDADAPTIPLAEDETGPPVSPSATPTTTTEGPSWTFASSRTTGLTLTLIGIGRIESMPDWEGTTSVFFEKAYNDERPRGGVQRHGGRDSHRRDADRGPAGVDGGRPRRGLGGGGGVGDDGREGRARALQSGGYTMVVVMYVQETWYLIDDPNSEPDEDFVLVPLSTEAGQVRGEAQVPERLRVPHRRFGNTMFAPD
jgi:hypothetical protein